MLLLRKLWLLHPPLSFLQLILLVLAPFPGQTPEDELQSIQSKSVHAAAAFPCSL